MLIHLTKTLKALISFAVLPPVVHLFMYPAHPKCDFRHFFCRLLRQRLKLKPKPRADRRLKPKLKPKLNPKPRADRRLKRK